MTKEDIVALALKITAFFLLLDALSSFSASYLNWDYVAGYGRLSIVIDLLVMLLPLIIAVILAIVIWKLSYHIANSMSTKTPPTSVEKKWSLSDIQITAFSVIGIFVLAKAIPTAFYHVYGLLITSIFNGSSSGNGPAGLSRYVYTGAQLLIGFWLLFGAKGLHNLLRKRDA